MVVMMMMMMMMINCDDILQTWHGNTTHHMMEIDEVDDARFGFAILKMLTLPPVNMVS